MSAICHIVLLAIMTKVLQEMIFMVYIVGLWGRCADARRADEADEVEMSVPPTNSIKGEKHKRGVGV